jgi:hypothetical protein
MVKPCYNNTTAQHTQEHTIMHIFEFLVAVGGNRGLTTRVRLQADDAYVAQQLAESQYGAGNIITYSQIT